METEPSSPDGDKLGSVLDQLVGQRLREQRVANGLEVVTIASALGVTVQRVADWEAGLYRIPARHLLTISTLLSCSLTLFFGAFLNESSADEEIEQSETKASWLFNRHPAKH